MSLSKWISKNTGALSGKTVAVSGATGGLGQELCRHLASLGAALILLDRNMQKSHALAEGLRADFPSLSVSHIEIDLEDIRAVRRAADELAARPLDYLILNAGAYSIPRHLCDTGYDNVFQINFLSPYYLARALLPHLRARGGRVVAVGSIAHTYSVTDPADVDFRTRQKASLVYGNAKRYLMFSLYGLTDADGSLSVTHPGITLTNITAHYPKPLFALIKHPMKVIFMSPRKASLCILRGLFEPCGKGEWIGPRFFSVWGMPQKRPLRSCDKTEAETICHTAEQLCRVLDARFFPPPR